MGATVAAKNRAVRQEALREKLAAMGLVQHVNVLVDKINDLKHDQDGAEFDMRKYKTAAELQLKLVAKYLPDLKSTELTGVDGEPLFQGISLERVTAKNTDS